MKGVKYMGVMLAACLCCAAYGQRFSVSTNVLGYANLCTLNLEGSVALHQHWTVNAGVRYNPFSFNEKGDGTPVRNRQRSFSAGARYWPWHTYSGWWIAGKVQYQEYNTGGIISARTEEGDRWGAGVSAGYTYMIHPSLNLEFGLGLWAGGGAYTVYSCPTCGMTEASGEKAFLLPNDIIIGISYVF